MSSFRWSNWRVGARRCKGQAGAPLSLELETPWILLALSIEYGAKDWENTPGRSFGISVYATTDW